MSEATKKFINIAIWVTIILFALRCWFDWENLSAAVNGHKIIESGYYVYGYAGEAIGAAAIFMALFNKWLWKFNIFNWIVSR